MANYAYLSNALGPELPVPEGPPDVGTLPLVELEAKYDLPLLWWAMFHEGDIRTARVADATDPEELEGDDGTPVDPDAVYPYLTTTQASAVAHLTRRRDPLAAAVGESLIPVVDAFTDVVRTVVGPHVLVRTADLIDLGLEADTFRVVIGELDKLGGDVTDDSFVALVRRQLAMPGADPLWILGGAGTHWPPPGLAAAHRPREDPAVPRRFWKRLGRERRPG